MKTARARLFALMATKPSKRILALNAYRSEVLAEAADSLRRALTTMVTDDFRRPGIAFACGALTGFAAGGAVAEAGKDIRDGIQPSADESTHTEPDLHSIVLNALSAGQGPLLPLPVSTVRILAARVVDAVTPLVPYRAVWDSSFPPGGSVCSICGEPVESEPCPDHAPATGDLTPLAIRWDRLVMHPSGEDTNTIVCCIAADTGQPVALVLDDEHREALGLQLVDPDGDNEVYADVPDDRCSACGCIDPGCTTCTSRTCRNDDPDEWVRCSASHCPNGERFAKATERGWTHHHMDTWRCPDHPVRPDAQTYADTRGEPGGDH